jgi:NTP pyrophosphatase (non-canonical NTP hydrolase)
VKIEKWAIDRNLQTAEPVKQMLKLGEEYGELCAGMARGDQEKIIDSVGDMFVVLTIFCLQSGIDLDFCVLSAYNEIKDRKGRMINGVFVKEEDLPKCTCDDDFKETCPFSGPGCV